MTQCLNSRQEMHYRQNLVVAQKSLQFCGSSSVCFGLEVSNWVCQKLACESQIATICARGSQKDTIRILGIGQRQNDTMPESRTGDKTQGVSGRVGDFQHVSFRCWLPSPMGEDSLQMGHHNPLVDNTCAPPVSAQWNAYSLVCSATTCSSELGVFAKSRGLRVLNLFFCDTLFFPHSVLPRLLCLCNFPSWY